jgi:hypothetical protein
LAVWISRQRRSERQACFTIGYKSSAIWSIRAKNRARISKFVVRLKAGKRFNRQRSLFGAICA